MNDIVPAFTGWHRPSIRHSWRALVQAESEEEAWGMLLCAVTGGDKTVTPLHRDPNNSGQSIRAGSRRARS
jgi:hypothetical protein